MDDHDNGRDEHTLQTLQGLLCLSRTGPELSSSGLRGL